MFLAQAPFSSLSAPSILVSSPSNDFPRQRRVNDSFLGHYKSAAMFMCRKMLARGKSQETINAPWCHVHCGVGERPMDLQAEDVRVLIQPVTNV